MAGLPARFWSALESRLLAGQDTESKVLLDAFVSYHIGQGNLSPRFRQAAPGNIDLTTGLHPPFENRVPLAVIFTMGFSLASFANSEEHPDAVTMLKAIQGELDGIPRRSDRLRGMLRHRTGRHHDSGLRDVISLINENSLAEKGSACRSTRPGPPTPLDTVLAQSHEAFNDTIKSRSWFICSGGCAVWMPMKPVQAFGAEAFALLERTFMHDGGGVKAALLEARTGIKGGMRYILDALTEQFKKEEREKEVNRVLLEALDPLDWESQVAFIKALMGRLSGHLPEDIMNQPPERYANHVHLLSKTYVESMDQLNHTFQML